MTRDVDEVKHHVRALTLRLIYDDISDHERKLIGKELNRIVPDPAYMDYVFYPTRTGLQDGPISDVVDRAIEKAFQYKPIIL